MADSKLVPNVLLAAWLQEQYPSLFADLEQHASQHGLSGITDILSSIGSGISSAASSVVSGLSSAVQQVGTFLSSDVGQKTLATLAAAKLQQAQTQQIVATQAARAAAGQTPAAISTQYNPSTGTYIPVMTTTTGEQVPLTQSALQSLRPSFLSQYGIWIAGGAAALVLVLMLMRNRG